MESIKLLREAGEQGELEARIGVYREGEFASGVTKEQYEHIISLLESCDTWRETDSFVSYDIFTFSGIRIRTILRDGVLSKPESVTKEIKSKLDMPIFGHNVRISVAREYPKDIVNDHHSCQKARAKKVKSFVSASGWRYDVSITGMGKNVPDAISQIENGDTKYEVEVELEDRDYLKKHNDAYVFESLLLKVSDLVVSLTGKFI